MRSNKASIDDLAWRDSGGRNRHDFGFTVMGILAYQTYVGDRRFRRSLPKPLAIFCSRIANPCLTRRVPT